MSFRWFSKDQEEVVDDMVVPPPSSSPPPSSFPSSARSPSPPAPDDSSSKEDHEYETLFEIMEASISKGNQTPILKISPTIEREEFNDEELEALKQRDFRTRVLFTDYDIDDNNAWIRSHHNDVGKHAHIDYVKEYFNAAFNHNHIAAKAAMSGILDSIFSMDEKEYYNFATIIASALSADAQYTSFEMTKSILRDYPSAGVAKTMARRRLILLMNIIFDQVLRHKFLVANSNIFRLVYCRVTGSALKRPLFFVFFSFCMQSCLGYFVVHTVVKFFQQNKQPEADLSVGLYFLACLGSIFCIVTALPDIVNAKTIFSAYGKQFGIVYIFDLIINVGMPFLLAVVGFRLVTLQDSYLNGVIMTTALLFIPEIDDALPDYLGFREEAIIENHLIYVAKSAYEEYARLTDDDVNKIFTSSEDVEGKEVSCGTLGPDFSDYFLTNSVDEGSDSHDFCQPFNVKRNTNGYGHELDPSSYITVDCLLSKVEWSYANKEIDAPINYLRVTKLTGEVVEVDFGVPVQQERVHQVKGVFMITNFVITASEIESLRMVGTLSPKCFQYAIEYYSLWELLADAKALLKEKVDGIAFNPQTERRLSQVKLT